MIQTYDKEYVDALIAVYEAAQKVMAVPGEVWHGKELREALAAVKTRQKDDE
jgi:hypothetical protein